MYRIEAIKHAQQANIAYASGVRAKAYLNYYTKALDIVTHFSNAHPVKVSTLFYFCVLIGDTIFSSRLIKPLAESFFQTDSFFAHLLFACIYAIIIFALTWNASKNYYQNHPDNIAFLTALQVLNFSPTSSQGMVEKQVKDNAKGKKKAAFFWILCLILLVVGLGLFRNYLINEHNGFFFNSPDDYLMVGIPLILGFCLIYLGKYKLHYFKLVEMRRKKKKVAKQVEELQERTIFESRQCMNFTTQADAIKEPPTNDRDTEICLERMKNIDVSSENFFDNLVQRTLRVTAQYSGTPLDNVSIQICTAEDDVLYGVTDQTGSYEFSWKSAHDYIKAIILYGKRLPGNKFSTGQHLRVDVGDIIGRYDATPEQIKTMFKQKKKTTASTSSANGFSTSSNHQSS